MPAGYHSVAEVRLYRRAYFENAVTQLGYIPSADARRTTLDLHAISDLMVRPGVREGLANASWRRSVRRDMLGK